MSSLNYKCVLFCEDIRQEIGGKVSLMGILGNKLLVQDFPLVFPKLCLFIEWGEVKENFNLVLNIIPPEGVEMGHIHPTANIGAQQGVVSRSMIVLTNFQFPKAGKYAFEFAVNGEIINREVFTVEKYEPAAQPITISTKIPASKLN